MAEVVDKEVVMTTYTVELTQEELNAIVSLSGSVVGGGKVREICDSIYYSLEGSSTQKLSHKIFKNNLETREDSTFG